VRASFQEKAAYRANFFISLLTSLLNLATGILGIVALFGLKRYAAHRVESART